MASVEELIGTVTAEFPELILDLSGPWDDRPLPGGDDAGEKVWICNFKQRDLFHESIHPGSAGASPAEALEAGLAAARDWRAGRNARAL